jgi:hypothetical protein
MRFALVLSSISAFLIAVIIAITISILSWIYPTSSSHQHAPSHKTLSSEDEAMKL